MISNQAISVSPSSKLAFRLRKDGTRGWGPIIGNRGRGGTRGMHHIDAQLRRQGDPPCGKWLVGFNFPIYSITNRIAEHRKESPLQSKLSGRASIYAALEHAYAPKPKGNNLKDLWATVSKELDAFCHFSRPHTVIGTIVGITSVSILPVESITDISPIFFLGLLKALLPAVLMNIYVVGLNQLFDVEIDKVNKPSLPLASGEYSMEKGIAIVTTCFILSFAMGIKSQSPPLLSALLISFLLGSAYSINLPFLRWKQHAFLAASCILCVRAILVQIAFFLHMQRYVLRRPAILTKPVLFATVFMCFFSAVIALFKDIPDVDGDRDFGIQSFSVHLGQERVFWLCIKLLTTAYVSAMLVGASSSSIFQKLVTVLGHGLLAFILWLHAQSLDIQNKASITSFYMFIWKLFYAEYFLIPFVR